MLYTIAQRARWRDGFNLHALSPGEALIGDHDACGLTEGEYRAAKKFLKRHGFATFRATTKGTVATITNTEVFDVSPLDDDEQNDMPTTGAQRTNDGPTTTNEQGNKETREQGSSARACKRPGWEEVKFHAAKIGLPEPLAVEFFREMQGNGWLDYEGKPIRSWRALLLSIRNKRQSQPHRNDSIQAGSRSGVESYAEQVAARKQRENENTQPNQNPG